MDKDKLMTMIDNYGDMECLVGSEYGYMTDLPSNIFSDLANSNNEIYKEIYSKPIMPKAFDCWYKKYNLLAQDKYYLLRDFDDVAFERIFVTDENLDLHKWLWENNSFEYSKYLTCIEAMVNGYEVEE